MPALSCDIFCKVIDNYGDIGVCWRLARQLAGEHGLVVRLWVDDLAAFARLDARVAAAGGAQQVAGVAIRPWGEAAAAAPAEIVIEAFACDPPEPYVRAMAVCAPAPVWLNLEYLSAEDWVEGCHALASPHPRLPLRKYFFFPGFTPATGGLIREAGLLPELDAVRAAPAAFWSRLGLAPQAGACTVSLFCYEHAGLPALLQAWAQGAAPVFCAVTAGRAAAQVGAWLGEAQAEPAPGAPCPVVQRGALQLAFLPFLPQPAYDALLAACDFNLVRGEDSFVRAQWAARPFAWHIYRQAEDAHRTKLDAFFQRYEAGLAPAPRAALAGFWQAWETGAGLPAAWPALRAALPVLQEHAGDWRQNLLQTQDLAANLLIFCKNLLECPALPTQSGASE